MRLPWPFNRADDGAESQPAEGTGSTTASSATEAPAADRLAPPTGAWSSLPPIQRSVGDPPLVAPAAAFLDGVPGARPLPPIVEPLGHDVSPIAPGGLVSVPVHAVPALTSSTSLVPRPVQRRADAVAAAAPVPKDDAVADPGPAASVPAPEPPARRLGIVPAAAAARPPDRPLTRAEPSPTGPNTSPGPLVARRTQVSSASAPSHDAATPVSRATTTSPGSAPVVARGAAPPPAPATPPPTAGRSRRPGLGAPIAATPSGAVPISGEPRPYPTLPTVARSAAGQPPTTDATPPSPDAGRRGFRTTTGAGPLRTTIQRHAETGPGHDHGPAPEPPGATTHDGSSTAASGPSLPSLPVLRAVRPPGFDAAAGSAPDRAAPAASPSGPSRPAGSVPAMPLQRSTAPATSGPAPAPPGPVRRPLTGSRPPLAAARVQRAHDGAPAAIPPAPAPESESPGIGPAASRGIAAGGPWGDTATHLAGEGIGNLPSAAAVATSFGDAALGLQRIPASPPRQSARPALARQPAAAPPSPMAAPPAQPAQPALGIVAGAPAAPTVQALPQSAPLVGPTATAVVQRIDGAAPAAPVEAEGHSESDLDDLARKLYGRFQNRLRAELIYEREAKGLTFDN